MKSAILIIARNNLALTKATLRTALAQEPVADEVLVINNASSDGTSAWLRTKDARVATYPEQRSLAACWNAGLKFLFGELGMDAVLVLNNDVEIRPDTLALLAEFSSRKVYKDDEFYPLFVSAVSVDDREKMGIPGDRGMKELFSSVRPHPDFSCWLARRELFDRLGYFFKEACFPAYFEDNFAHVKMAEHGITPVCVDLPFYHVGASTLKHADPAEVAAIKRGAQRNREMFRMKYGCLPGSKEYEELCQPRARSSSSASLGSERPGRRRP